jgi:hypothetical protein
MKIPHDNKDIVHTQEKEIPMPRKPKMYLPGIPSHVVQRGNDRNPASSKKTIIGSCWIAWVMHASDTTSLFMPMY